MREHAAQPLPLPLIVVVMLQLGQKARQVLQACERTPTDALDINYDPRNPFDLCSLTFTPIYR